MIVSSRNAIQRDRLLAIGESSALGDYLRQRYPDCDVDHARSLLEGIDELSHHEVRAVIAQVDPAAPRLGDALAGLRDAAGGHTRLLLCGQPEEEPQLRDALQAGADDYVLWPIEGGELDKAIGLFDGEDQFAATNSPGVSLEEIPQIDALINSFDGESFTVLRRLADLVRTAMGAESVTLVVDGTAASSGGTVADPVLTEPIVRDGKSIGRISVGQRFEPYVARDMSRLQQYAHLAASMLEVSRRQREWRAQAHTDDVSGLYSRRYVRQFLSDLLEKARGNRFRVTVLLFDIDDFKAFNDRFGHPAGDEIIRCIGQLFKTHCREHDVVARYGGDEFCVVFWDADQPRVAGSTHPADALTVLSRFRKALRSYHCASMGAETTGQLTISGGLASYPWDAATTDELIHKADQALLHAKASGKNQVFVFGEDTQDPSSTNP